MTTTSTLTARLREQSRAADELHERSRSMLVRAAREGAAAGLTQRQISQAIGRSQPEVSRLLRFRGRTPLGRAVAHNRAAILRATTMAGMRNVRVFGSVSRGEDTAQSDVDLLVDLDDNVSLLDLARLESAISKLVGAKVDVVSAAGLRANLRDKVLTEAVPL